MIKHAKRQSMAHSQTGKRTAVSMSPSSLVTADWSQPAGSGVRHSRWAVETKHKIRFPKASERSLVSPRLISSLRTNVGKAKKALKKRMKRDLLFNTCQNITKSKEGAPGGSVG